MVMVQRLLIAAAVAIFALAGYFYWVENRDPWALAVVQSEMDVGSILLNEEKAVSWTLVNNSDKDWRVVGILDEPC